MAIWARRTRVSVAFMRRGVSYSRSADWREVGDVSVAFMRRGVSYLVDPATCWLVTETFQSPSCGAVFPTAPSLVSPISLSPVSVAFMRRGVSYTVEGIAYSSATSFQSPSCGAVFPTPVTPRDEDNWLLVSVAFMRRGVSYGFSVPSSFRRDRHCFSRLHAARCFLRPTT